jgi:hypothetical protein
MTALASPPATLSTADALLHPWLTSFERFFQRPVAIERFPADVHEGPAQRLTIARVISPIELLGGTGYFKHRPAVVEHVRRLGFDWEPDGRILTFPTPATFNRLLEQFGSPDAGLRLTYDRVVATTERRQFELGTWLRRYLTGALTVYVCDQSNYDELFSAPGEAPWHTLRWQLSMLPHDITVHALNYHLVPHAALRELEQRIAEALPDRFLRWSSGEDAAVPLTLSHFIDNDLNRYTYAVWSATERPEEFGRNFLAPARYQQLLDALAIRLDETKRGLGDMPSGDFNDVQPLQPTQFRPF